MGVKRKPSATKKQVLSVLIPVYNEMETIGSVLDQLLQLNSVKEVIVVDDCSTDQTPAILSRYRSTRVIVHRLPRNSGKTAAIARALREARGELVIIQDADLEYDPAEIIDVIDPILEGRADVVYGSRFMVRKAARVLYFWHFLANKSLTFLSNVFTNLNMTDIETCYKAFRTPIIKNLELTSHGFGMEVEITALISRLPLRIYEVPISYYGRTYEEGKKIGLRDGIMAVFYIFYYNLLVPMYPRSRRYFAAVRRELGL